MMTSSKLFFLIYLIFSKTLANPQDPLVLISTCYQSGLEVILVKVSWYQYWMTVSIGFPSKLVESVKMNDKLERDVFYVKEGSSPSNPVTLASRSSILSFVFMITTQVQTYKA